MATKLVMGDPMGDADVHELRRWLEERPADRFPVHHASGRYHLGVLLARQGRSEEAEVELVRAAELLEGRLPEEHARVLNALGAVLRDTGRLDAAEKAFRFAAETFRREGMAIELGAVTFNLGLVAADRGELELAIAWIRDAARSVSEDAEPAQRASMDRELGGLLLRTGDAREARGVLRDAVEGARRVGDRAGEAAAANALGLAELETGDVDAARDALERAAVVSPPAIRPELHAMAKANLALAHERAGEHVLARLAAAQAASLPEGPVPVGEQATGVLERLGPVRGDLARALRATPSRERRNLLVRDELARWVRLGEEDRAAEMRAWIEAIAGVTAAGPVPMPAPEAVELAEEWVGGLLELPPEALERLVAVAVAVLVDAEVVGAELGGSDASDRLLDPSSAKVFRSRVSSAMARFAVPQWLRLRDHFEHASAALGWEVSWA